MTPTAETHESTRAVIVAGLANLAIALAKLVAGILSNSAAMLAEAAHSFADTVTEVLLFIATRVGDRPPSRAHPLGHGRLAFVWALAAAIATFTLGAGFSITHGLHELTDGGAPTDLGLNLAVLAISAVLEALSLRTSRRIVRARAAGWRTEELAYLRETSDTAIRAVYLEDVIALVGLAVAAVGIIGSVLADSPVWDAGASILVGLLLLAAAVLLAARNLSLLVGRAAPPSIVEAMTAVIAGSPGVAAVGSVVTEAVGPARYLVVADVTVSDGADPVAVTTDARDALVARFPIVVRAHLQPTRSTP